MDHSVFIFSKTAITYLQHARSTCACPRVSTEIGNGLTLVYEDLTKAGMFSRSGMSYEYAEKTLEDISVEGVGAEEKRKQKSSTTRWHNCMILRILFGRFPVRIPAVTRCFNWWFPRAFSVFPGKAQDITSIMSRPLSSKNMEFFFFPFLFPFDAI
jgi:hypothetical protein